MLVHGIRRGVARLDCVFTTLLGGWVRMVLGCHLDGRKGHRILRVPLSQLPGVASNHRGEVETDDNNDGPEADRDGESPVKGLRKVRRRRVRL